MMVSDEFHPTFNHGRWNKYHYYLFSDKNREAFKILKIGMNNGETEIILPPKYGDVPLKAIFNGIINDCPMIFWYSYGFSYSLQNDGLHVLLTTNKYYDDRAEYARQIRRLSENLFTDHVQYLKSEFEVELFVHDYITSHVKYDESDPVACHNIIGPMLEGKGVCDGISFMANYLMSAFGLTVTKINSTSPGDDDGHAWNIVLLDGKFYHLDVTYDLGEDSSPNHSHMNLTDDMALKNHNYNKIVKCEGTEYNYYRQKQLWFVSEREAKHAIPPRLMKEKIIEFYIEKGCNFGRLLNRTVRSLRRNCSGYVLGHNTYMIKFE